MIMLRKIQLTSLLLFLLCSANVFSQDEKNDDENNGSGNLSGVKGFHIGFYLGACFPNKNSAEIYDGNGYDVNGNKNAPYQTYLYNKIITENNNSAGNGTDRITTALGLTSREYWKFDSVADVPTNLKYNTAFLFGLAVHYGFDKKQALIANLNFAKLTAVGNFNIETHNSSLISPPYYNYNNPFAIIGNEQRMMIQLGYSRILGDNDKFNFFVEGGLCVNNAKFVKNFVQINSLELDLTTFTNYGTGIPTVYSKYYNGWGFGGFAGLGFNLSANSKYTIQILYTPSYEKINLGSNASATLQNAAGLRAYYNL